MTASRDPDRLIHAFLMEGEEELHDQVYDAVRAEIEQKRQRAGFGPWREISMNKFLAIGLGAAAVIAVLLIGSNLLGSSTPPPGGAPSESVAPSEAPSEAEPSTAAGLPVGSSHLFWESLVGITVTIPAPGWDGDVGDGILIKEDSADPPDGAGMIVFTGPLLVYGDACHWSTTQADTPATTVDEVVAALAAQTPRDASEPTDVTVGGYSGKLITLHVPEDAAYSGGQFTDCDEGYFGSWTVPEATPTEGPYRYHQGPGQIDDVYILDVNGVLVAWDTAHYAGTPTEDVDEIRAIIESATFEAL